MRRLRWALLTIAVLLPLAGTVCATKPEPIGDPLSIFESGYQEFPAGSPFHIKHGFSIDPSEGYPISKFWFELEIDGQLIEPDYIDRFYVPGDDDPLYQRSVYNFPDGMTGTHGFSGHWFAPCQWAVDYGLDPGPCDGRFDPVEIKTTWVEVTFVP